MLKLLPKGADAYYLMRKGSINSNPLSPKFGELLLLAVLAADCSPMSARHVAGARTPWPPATIKVLIALEGLRPRASISTPDELRTGPGVAASTRIVGAAGPAKRPAISNTEIGPEASRIWKSGNIRMPIMIELCPEMREK